MENALALRAVGAAGFRRELVPRLHLLSAAEHVFRDHAEWRASRAYEFRAAAGAVLRRTLSGVSSFLRAAKIRSRQRRDYICRVEDHCPLCDRCLRLLGVGGSVSVVHL